MQNIELKVQLANHRAIRDHLKRAKARRVRTIDQVDTYFRVRSGKLKLRAIDKKRAELIRYERPRLRDSKVSQYTVVPLSMKQATQLFTILEGLYAPLVVVVKKRELWMIKKTRIHLDVVHGLGTYLELETVVGERSLARAHDEHKQVIDLLDLDGGVRVAVSYSDLLLSKKKK